MKRALGLLAATLALATGAMDTTGAASAAEPVRVLVLGSYHFGNPGLDVHNAKVDDVLTPRRQAEVAAVVQALAGFAPTRVVVEDRADHAPQHTVQAYRDFLAGKRPGQRNEIDQIGFRLAQQRGHADVHGIDAPGDFPFEPVQRYAQARGLGAQFQQNVDSLGAMTKEFERLQATSTVGQLLRWHNEPARLLENHAWYMQTLRYGSGAEQPGARLVAAWYARNLGSCARLVQITQPGDRVLVLYGSGHAHLLRRCVQEMPGWLLVEPGEHLPR